MYSELRRDELPVDLPDVVVWQRRPGGGAGGGGGGRGHRIVPDGCLDLIWSDGVLLVAGPDTRAHLTPADDRAGYVGARFAAGLGPAVLGVPAVELRDARVPLDALWPGAAVRELAEAMAAGQDLPETLARPAALARAVAARMATRMATPDPRTGALWRTLRAGSRVDTAAAAIGLSPRQLHRRCLHAFGYGPKTLARVLRFDRAVSLARTGTALAEVAASTGYADQAHLSREVREFAGLPLGALLAESYPTGPL